MRRCSIRRRSRWVAAVPRRAPPARGTTAWPPVGPSVAAAAQLHAVAALRAVPARPDQPHGAAQQRCPAGQQLALVERGVEPPRAVEMALGAEQGVGLGCRKEFERQRRPAAPRFGIGQRVAAPRQRQRLFRRRLADDGVDSQPDHSRPPLCRGRISSVRCCSVPVRARRTESLTVSTGVHPSAVEAHTAGEASSRASASSTAAGS